LTRGDALAAATAAQQAGGSPPATLLGLQAQLVAESESTVSELQNLTEDNPNYAAAWLTLSAAAETGGDRRISLESARTGAELWPIDRWQERAEGLQSRWVDEPVAEAADLLARDLPESALEALEPALAAQPGGREPVLLQASILLAMDEPDRAEAALVVLPRDDEVTLLAGRIAEARGDSGAALRIYSSIQENPAAAKAGIRIAEDRGEWQTAMQLYQSLPDDDPEKAGGLRRAKLRWRLSVMPSYVSEALQAKDLTREELAVILVSLAPRVETLPGGEVPLLSDIMQLPTQREILAAVRVGLVETDRFERLYYPHRQATATEVRTALDRLGELLQIDGPRWCGAEPDPCVAIEQPVAGDRVANLVIEMVARDAE
jgi:tetratricopeptide (TPR) repeat protein